MRLVLCVCLFLAPFAGCVEGGRPEASPPSVVERDSSGVRIVENFAPVHAPGAWSVGSVTPLCSARDDDRIGQVSAIVPLDGDTVAVMSGQGQRLLICVGGRVVASHGGEGEGPGEYRFVRGLHRVSRDTVALVENERVTYLDLRTRGVRTLAPPAAHPDATRFLGSPFKIVASRRSPGAGEGPSTGAPRRYDLFDAANGSVDSPDFEEVAWSDALPGSGPEIALWAPGLTWALSESSFWFVERNETDLQLRTIEGVRRIVRAEIHAPSISESVWSEARSRLRAGLSDQGLPEAVLTSMLEIPEDRRVYPIRQMEPDPEGRLWVRLAQEDPMREPAPWRVFDARGRWVTDVHVPRDVQVRFISNERIYGVQLDELDLQTVVVLPIRR
ncbi:hypothetical protein WI372_15760 [Gemmatimonadota bacterium DH-20]|uniref:6-bladed beta-propeller n=1 Tax=Gaopeijia maritima TaxID=3119007 RepID=A0ABU9EET2_9BACT